MNRSLEFQRYMLRVITFGKWMYIILGTAGLIIGSLTNKSPWWIAPMIMAGIVTAAESVQERRIKELERRQL